MESRHDESHDPSGPHFAARPSLEDVIFLLRLVSHDDVNFDDIVAALESRPLIASLYLRSANSVGLGAVHQVRSLRHALAILGLQRIREILFTLREAALAERARVAG